MSYFSYKKLYDLMKSRGIHTFQLQEMTGLTAPTMSKLSRNLTVRTDTLIKICDALHVQPYDIMEYIPDDKHVMLSDSDIMTELYNGYSIYHDYIDRDIFDSLVLKCIYKGKANGNIVIDQEKLTKLVKNKYHQMTRAEGVPE